MPVSSLLINTAIVWLGLQYWPWLRSQIPHLAILARALTWLGAIWLLFIVSTYLLLQPIFYDHAETTTVSLAAHLLWGGPFYHDLAAADRYTTLYGPVPALLTVPFLLLGNNSQWLGKLPSILACGLSLLIYWHLVKPLTSRHWFFAPATLAVGFLNFYNMSFWNRPDPYITLFVTGAVWVTESAKSRLWSALLIGVLAGLATDCKIHSGIYFLPVAGLWLERFGRRDWAIAAAVVGTAALITAWLPYASPQISLIDFQSLISMPLKQKFHVRDGFKYFSYMLPFVALLLLQSFRPKANIGTQRSAESQASLQISLTNGLFLLSLSVVGCLTAKPGSGVQLFLPMLPLAFFLIARRPVQDQSKQYQFDSLLLALALTLSNYAFERQRHQVHFLTEIGLRNQEFAELKELTAPLKGTVEMGYAGPPHYESSFYKPWLVRQGRGLFIDASAMMEMQFSGHSLSNATYDKLASCAINYFIIPRGDPAWQMSSFYVDPKPIFDARWLGLFKNHYHLVRAGGFFDLYQCSAGNGTQTSTLPSDS